MIEELGRKDALLTCPYCDSVKYVGVHTTKKDWTKQWICRNPQCPHLEKVNTVTFSRHTSKEGRKLQKDLLIAITGLFARGLGYREICEALGVTKHFVEISVKTFAKALEKKIRSHLFGLEKLANLNEFKEFMGKRVIPIYFDTSASGVSSKYPIVQAVIQGISVAGFRLFSHDALDKFLVIITEALDYNPYKDQLLFISDGEARFIEIIQTNFPYAIHVRQIHDRKQMGLVYIHFSNGEKECTFSTKWDFFLNNPHEYDQLAKRRNHQRQWRKEHSTKERRMVETIEEFYDPFKLLTEIKGLDEKRVELIREKYQTIDNLKTATIEELIQLKGITESKAQQIIDKANQKYNIPITFVKGARVASLSALIQPKDKSVRQRLKDAAKTGKAHYDVLMGVREYKSYIREHSDEFFFNEEDMLVFVAKPRKSSVQKKSNRRSRYEVHPIISVDKVNCSRLDDVLEILDLEFAGKHITSNPAETPFGHVKARLGSRRTSKAGEAAAIITVWNYYRGKDIPLNTEILDILDGANLSLKEASPDWNPHRIQLEIRKALESATGSIVEVNYNSSRKGLMWRDLEIVSVCDCPKRGWIFTAIDDNIEKTFKIARVTQIREATVETYLRQFGIIYLTKDFNHYLVKEDGSKLRTSFSAPKLLILLENIAHLEDNRTLSLKKVTTDLMNRGISISPVTLQSLCCFITGNRLGSEENKYRGFTIDQIIFETIFEHFPYTRTSFVYRDVTYKCFNLGIKHPGEATVSRRLQFGMGQWNCHH